MVRCCCVFSFLNQRQFFKTLVGIALVTLPVSRLAHHGIKNGSLLSWARYQHLKKLKEDYRWDHILLVEEKKLLAGFAFKY
jgi:hypothetical protein